jgi:hypothetical protein
MGNIRPTRERLPDKRDLDATHWPGVETVWRFDGDGGSAAAESATLIEKSTSNSID